MNKSIAGFLSLVALLITSCESKSPKVMEDPWHWKWTYTEIERVESPDKKVDAVVVYGDVGAVAATRIYIYIVPHNSKIIDNDRETMIFLGERLKNLKVVWKGWRLLEIQYDEAQIVDFKNYWESAKVDDYQYVVDIELLPKQEYSLPFNVRIGQ